MNAHRGELLGCATRDAPDLRGRHRRHDAVEMLGRVLPDVHDVVARGVFFRTDRCQLRQGLGAADRHPDRDARVLQHRVSDLLPQRSQLFH